MRHLKHNRLQAPPICSKHLFLLLESATDDCHPGQTLEYNGIALMEQEIRDVAPQDLFLTYFTIT